MWQRFTLDDIRTIAHYLGMLTLCYSAAFVVCFCTALFCQEWDVAPNYLTGVGIALILGNILRLAKIEPGHLSRRQALAVTGLAWIFLSVISAIPLYMSGHYSTFLDAVFEGVSGLTNTGLTLVVDIDHLSNADNMFRFIMHFVGGLGLIVVALSIGFMRRRGGSSLYSAEGRSEHVVPNVLQSTRFILGIAVSITLIGALLVGLVCAFIGMAPERAFLQGLWLAISAFDTGGFAPMSASVVYYHCVVVEVVLLVIMLLGSVNFVLYLEVWKGRVRQFFNDIEIRTMFVWFLVVGGLVMAASLSASKLFSDLPSMMRRGVFMSVSAATTTGFQNITGNQMTSAFSSGAFLILAILMAVGGSAGSTTGGIKLRRVGLIAKAMVATIKEALAPDSARVVVTYNHLGRRILDSGVTKEAMTVFTLYVITYTAGSLVGIAYGYDAVSAIFESVATTSNGGLTSGITTPGMPLGLEVFYILQMWAGRLEFVTLLALLVEIIVTCKPDTRLRSWIRKLRSGVQS